MVGPGVPLSFGGFTGEMTARVQAMHPDLAWELAPGAQAEHALVVTSAGVPEQRRIADSDDPVVTGQVRDIVSGWPGAAVSASPDAGWRAIRHLTR